jgi:hypothetical protein
MTSGDIEELAVLVSVLLESVSVVAVVVECVLLCGLLSAYR